jgi:hypothetical protein
LASNFLGSSLGSLPDANNRRPEITTKKSTKKAAFGIKKGFFIVGRTEAFNWTAKLSIIPSEKKPFRKK